MDVPIISIYDLLLKRRKSLSTELELQHKDSFGSYGANAPSSEKGSRVRIMRTRIPVDVKAVTKANHRVTAAHITQKPTQLLVLSNAKKEAMALSGRGQKRGLKSKPQRRSVSEQSENLVKKKTTGRDKANATKSSQIVDAGMRQKRLALSPRKDVNSTKQMGKIGKTPSDVPLTQKKTTKMSTVRSKTRLKTLKSKVSIDIGEKKLSSVGKPRYRL